MEDKVTLYIATHNITGKKYFGKTVKWFTEEDLQKNYHGSGVYWSKHKKKHGNKDVTMEIYQICSLNESDEDYVVPIALKFSEENNIVESDEWANLKDENGLDGGVIGQRGFKWSIETRSKLSNMIIAKNINTGNIVKVSSDEFYDSDFLVGINKDKKLTEEHKQKISPEGRVQSEECKRKIGDAHRGKIVSKETKQKLKNVERTIEWNKNISTGSKNREQVMCPHCDKTGDISNMKRWHFDKCKYK